MKIHAKSAWNQTTICAYLAEAEIPMRLAFINQQQEPMLCSLWFYYDNGRLFAASHENTYLIKQLQANPKASFEISNNDYPYKGVRGKATAVLSKQSAQQVMQRLIDKYLQQSNQKLATWLLSRIEHELVIELQIDSINAWDFSNRMQA